MIDSCDAPGAPLFVELPGGSGTDPDDVADHHVHPGSYATWVHCLVGPT